jgi:hypothetical protein
VLLFKLAAKRNWSIGIFLPAAFFANAVMPGGIIGHK